VEALTSARLKLVEKAIIDAVEKCIRMGWDAAYNVSIEGESGIPHKFLMVVWPSKGGKPDVVVDIIEEEAGVSEDDVLRFVVKCVDVDARYKILVASPHLSWRAKLLLMGHDTKIIELCRNNLSDISLEIFEAAKEVCGGEGSRVDNLVSVLEELRELT